MARTSMWEKREGQEVEEVFGVIIYEHLERTVFLPRYLTISAHYAKSVDLLCAENIAFLDCMQR